MLTSIPELKIRKAPEQIRLVLDELDEAAANHAADSRITARYTYRVKSLVAEFEDVGGQWRRYHTPSRNISLLGIALLVGRFIYPKTRCRILLTNVHDQCTTIEGTVVRCRYLQRTGSVYEVGVKFDQTIDVGMFRTGADTLRVLVADDDPTVHRLIERSLDTMNAKLTFVESGAQAIAAAKDATFDLAFIDLDMPETDGYGVARELRGNHYAHPLIALSAGPEDAGIEKHCHQSGFNICLPKPCTRGDLQRAVLELTAEDVVSTRVKEKQMATAIDRFVGSLMESLVEIEDAFAREDDQRLNELAGQLETDAGEAGFNTIRDAATKLIATAKDSVPRPVVRTTLNAVCRLCFAAQPATKGEK